MHPSVDAVADRAPWRLQPVASISTRRRRASDERPEPGPEQAVSFRAGAQPAAVVYAPPCDIVASVRRFAPDSVAPALAEALASEPWGHPMPQKSVWEQAVAARERHAEPAAAAVTVAAASATPPAPAASSAPAATPVATTAAAPATHAAVDAAGSAAPVATVWLTSLLKAR